MSFRNRFKSNPDVEKNGKWFTADDSDLKKPVQFKLAYLGTSNPKFLKSGEKRARPFRKVDPGVEVSLGIAMEVFLDSGLLDWRNVTMEGGDDMPFNRENAKQLFKDLPRLYELLVAVAQDSNFFNDDERDMEAEAKNSQTSLPTK